MYVNHLLRVREKNLFPNSMYQKRMNTHYKTVARSPSPTKDYSITKPRRLPPIAYPNTNTSFPSVSVSIPSRNESFPVCSSDEDSSDDFSQRLVPKFYN